ncbi:hypothetical protein FQR65_LT00904 [Abscondita terminalis]|nr:hypothetical protein FQR65_LT00904 [Abscondita terminalis]
MDEQLEDNIKCCVQTICKKLNVSHYVYETSPVDKKGKNFVSSIYRVKVSGQNKFKGNVNIRLILKMAPVQNFVREGHGIQSTYSREVYTYEKILPCFFELEANCGVQNFYKAYPRYYTSSTMEMREFVILEDMEQKDYKMLKTIDIDHAKLIIMELGKFHALSFALQKQKFEAFCEIKDNIHDFEFDDKFESAYRFMCELGLKTLDPARDDSVYKKYLGFCKQWYTIIKNSFNELNHSQYAVITHGDVWLPNLMFKYQGRSSPTNVCMLDWQFVRIGSPAFDISQFLFICCDTEIRNNHYASLIENYYESLSTHLRLLGESAKEVFPFRILMEHLKKYSVIGLISAIKTSHMMCVHQEQPNLRKPSNFEEYVSAFLHLKIDLEKYNPRMKSIILDYINFGYDM